MVIGVNLGLLAAGVTHCATILVCSLAVLIQCGFRVFQAFLMLFYFRLCDCNGLRLASQGCLQREGLLIILRLADRSCVIRLVQGLYLSLCLINSRFLGFQGSIPTLQCQLRIYNLISNISCLALVGLRYGKILPCFNLIAEFGCSVFQ